MTHKHILDGCFYLVVVIPTKAKGVSRLRPVAEIIAK
jgi:hypothetical protein